jgi:hypothetical protein
MVIEKAFIASGEFHRVVVAVVLNHWCFEVARKQSRDSQLALWLGNSLKTFGGEVCRMKYWKMS